MYVVYFIRYSLCFCTWGIDSVGSNVSCLLIFLIFHVVSFSSRRLYDTTDEGAAAWHRRMMIDEQKRGSDGKGAGSGKRAMDVDGVA